MQSAFDYVNPRRYDMAGTATKGAKRKTKMYDGVAQDAFWDWVNGVLGWGVSESLIWQRAAISEKGLRDSDAVQYWLDEATEQMSWEFTTGNFYDCFPEQVQDGGSGGTAVMITEEAMDLSCSVHRVPHPGAYWIAEDAEGRPNVYHERLPLTARQAFGRFNNPTDTLHPTIRKWAKDPSACLSECQFMQCICPADDPAIFTQRMTQKRWAIVTYLESMTGSMGHVPESVIQSDSDRLVRVEGLDFFSPTVWRFRKNSDEPYGYSPAFDVMTMIEAAQQHGFNLMNMGNRAADPVTWNPEELRGHVSYLPGAKNYYGNEKRIGVTMPTAGEYPVAVDRENKVHELIRKRYGWHVWNAILGFQLKKERVQAAEVEAARSDQARLLTGQMNNLWRCGVRPTYDNVFYIASRAGRMPDPPAELQDKRGKDIIVPVFVGPLSQIQIYATKLGGVQQGLRLLADIAEVVGRHVGSETAAQIYDRVKLPDLSEYVCDYSGFPQHLMRTDEEVEQVIVSREQRQRANEAAEQAQRIAAASAQLGKEPGRNSLLMAGAA